VVILNSRGYMVLADVRICGRCPQVKLSPVQGIE
jgi:hypothetical protein